MDDMERTRDYLAKEPEAKWGFVIYRTTYQDDDQWNRFMEHINTRVRLELEQGRDAELFTRIDWCVQEDPALEGAPVSEVRRYAHCHHYYVFLLES